MGIPGFSSWLRRQYPEAFQHFAPEDGVDHLYLDLPSTLHIVTRKARTKTYFHKLLHSRLDELLAATNPARRVVFALDGPAPLAKLLEQRRRRRKEADRASRSRPSKKRSSAISPLSITTGSILMLEIHASLACYICTKLSQPEYQHLQFELSDSTVKGEGELKILSRLLHERSNSQNNDPENHLVIGGDSDLLLMGAISGQSGVFICPDGPDSGLTEGTAIAFSRDTLEEVWKRDILGQDASDVEVTGLALDLALLAIMSSGNDYLPACQGLQLSNKHRPGLWPLYLDMRRQPEWQNKSLVGRTCPSCPSDTTNPTNQKEKKDTVQGSDTVSCDEGGPSVWINKEMLSVLLQRYCDQRYVFEPEGKLDGVTGVGSWNVMANGPINGSNKNTASTDDPTTLLGRFPAKPVEYIKGLEWVLGMYSTGAVQDYRWTYLGGAPSVPTLINFLNEQQQQAEEELVGGGSNASFDVDATAASINSSDDMSPSSQPGGELEQQQTSPTTNTKQQQHRRSLPPLVPAACALALLPARGRQHAATALRHLMDADSPVAEIYAVCSECQRLGNELSSVGREFEQLRTEFASLQSELSASSSLDSETPLEVESHLVAAIEKCEAAQTRLKSLLAELSRSQQEHLIKMHPPTPFPTAKLEAAVRSVPIDDYPKRERRLARFGREMAFRWGEEELNIQSVGDNSNSSNVVEGVSSSSSAITALNGSAAASSSDVTVEDLENNNSNNNTAKRPSMPSSSSSLTRNNSNEFPGWIHECLGFARAYPNITDPAFVKGTGTKIVREILPLHPYMQPNNNFNGGLRKNGFSKPRRQQQGSNLKGNSNSSSTPMAIALACQLRTYSTGNVPGYSGMNTARSVSILGMGPGSKCLGMSFSSSSMQYKAVPCKTMAYGAISSTSASLMGSCMGDGVSVVNRPLMHRGLLKCMALLPRFRALRFV